MKPDLQQATTQAARQDAVVALHHVNSERLRAAIAGLASFGGRTDGGVSRQTLTDADLQARRWLVDRAHALGCVVEVDDCANLFSADPVSQNCRPF